MPFIPVPNGCKAIISGHTGNRDWSITLWFRKVDFNIDDMQDLADGLYEWIDDKYQVPVVDDTTFDLITLYDMRTIDGLKTVKTVDLPGLHDDVPASVGGALVVTFYAAKRGKWNSGRNFCPGLAEDNVNEYRVEDPSADDYLAVYQELIDNPIAGWQWSICSTRYNNAPREAGVLAAVETVAIRNTILGSQKRRLRKT
jgi:hypothetical protein